MADRQRILVADDDPDLLELLKMDLALQEYDVLIATNGNEALDVASKEKLGIAVAEKYSHDVKAFLESVTRTHDDPWDQFRAYLDFVVDIMHTQDRICAAGSVQSEINVVPPAMGKSMCSLVEFVIDWIADVIADGRKRGVMEFPGTAQNQAAMIFSAAQGAMQYGRAQGVKKSRSVMKQIAAGLKPKS